MSNPVVHFEFWTRQAEEVAQFYEAAFGWKINHIPEMDYRVVEQGEKGIGGGIMVPQDGELPGNMALYLDTDNLEATVQRIKDAGGTMIVEEQVIPGVGRFALFADPEGRVNGVWEQSEPSEDCPGS